jgi:ATP-dependent helicase/DNAse subunit B
VLARHGLPLLPPDPADERSLFYETTARAWRSLTLSRAYLDESGNLLPVSPYVNAVRRLFARHSITTSRIAAGSTPALDEALSLPEQLIALMQQPPGSATPDQEAPALLAHVRRACAVEQTRESLQPYTAFDGRIDAADLREALAQRFGAAHRWSVTQFNDYITCPFRFFAAHVLHLQQRSEPEEGLESAGVGIISHDILAKAGAGWLAAQYPMTPDHEEAILALLDAAATEVLENVSTRADFVAGTFWRWEQADLRQRLARAIRRMLHEDGETWAGFRVASVESGFGLRQGTPPLILHTPAGPVRIVGRIDRLDQREDGALALIDYKSSSSPRTLEDTKSGRDLQLPIYLLAAEQLIAPGQRVERAVFFHLGSGKRSPALTDKHREETLAAAQARVAESVQGVHSGQFAVHPPEKCAVGCAFAAICRLNLARRDANR